MSKTKIKTLITEINTFVDLFIKVSEDEVGEYDILRKKWKTTDVQNNLQDIFVRVSKIKKLQKPKDENKNAPKKPLSSFMQFSRMYADEHGKTSTKELTEIWGNFSAEEKEHYNSMSRNARKEYEVEYEKYKETPEYKKYEKQLEKWYAENNLIPPIPKQPKDENAPKKPLTGFMLYYQKCREKETKKGRSVDAKFKSACSLEWKEMTKMSAKSQPKVYKDCSAEAKILKEEYETEMKSYKPSREYIEQYEMWERKYGDKKKKKTATTTKKNGEMKKPPTAFQLFLQDKYSEAKKENPTRKRFTKEENAELKETWKDLSDEEKEVFENKHAELVAEYNLATGKVVEKEERKVHSPVVEKMLQSLRGEKEKPPSPTASKSTKSLLETLKEKAGEKSTNEDEDEDEDEMVVDEKDDNDEMVVDEKDDNEAEEEKEEKEEKEEDGEEEGDDDDDDDEDGVSERSEIDDDEDDDEEV